MAFLTLATIRKRVKELAKLVNAPKDLTKVHGCPDWMGSIYVEVDDRGYHYVFYERGEEYERRTTTDIKELLYWILEGITFKIAEDYELRNRIPNIDIRRLLFEKQLELMGLIDPEYRKRLEIEINYILEGNPFVDEIDE